MKRIGLVFAFCAFLFAACARKGTEQNSVHLPADATAQERAFAASLIIAFGQKDPAQLVRLSHWVEAKGQPPFHRDFYASLIARGSRKITVTRVDPKLATERIENDTKVRESLPVQWFVVVEHPADYDSKTELYAGLDGDMIKFTTSYVVSEEPKQASESTSRPRDGSP